MLCPKCEVEEMIEVEEQPFFKWYCPSCMLNENGDKVVQCQDCQLIFLEDDCRDMAEPEEGHYYVCDACWEQHKHAWGGE